MNYQHYFDKSLNYYNLGMNRYIKGMYVYILTGNKTSRFGFINAMIDINSKLNDIRNNGPHK